MPYQVRDPREPTYAQKMITRVKLYKAQIKDLEETASALDAEVFVLDQELSDLKDRYATLQQENEDLKLRLQTYEHILQSE